MRNFKRFAIIVAGIIALIMVVILVVVFWQGSTKDIVAEANKFQPPAEWTLTSEQVEPPRLVCFGDMACPEITRSWKNDTHTLTYDNLKSILLSAGWEFVIEGDCLLSTEASGSVSLCHATGVAGKYNIYVDYSTLVAHQKEPLLSINIREQH